MTNGENYPKKGLRTQRELHVYHVFNDPEFINEVERLNADFEITASKFGHKGTAEEIGKRYEAIIKEFAVNRGDIDFFMAELHKQGSTRRQHRCEIIYNADTNSYTAQLKPDVSKDDLEEAWQYIQRINGLRKISKTRRRGFDDPQLVYAIFRAKKSGKSFPAIFTLYQEGKLPHYENKPRNQFSSVEYLKRYYYRYSPERGGDS